MRPTKVRTKSGTIYEFEWNTLTENHRFGRVRKGDGGWRACNLLTPIEVGQPMKMALGFQWDSPIRTTSRVQEILA